MPNTNNLIYAPFSPAAFYHPVSAPEPTQPTTPVDVSVITFTSNPKDLFGPSHPSNPLHPNYVKPEHKDWFKNLTEVLKKNYLSKDAAGKQALFDAR